jgi:hypothetical protein
LLLAEELRIFAAQESVYTIQLFGWLLKKSTDVGQLHEWESSVGLNNFGTKVTIRVEVRHGRMFIVWSYALRHRLAW